MALSLAQQATLNTASRPAVRGAFSGVRQHWPTKQWLSARNRYRDDSVKRIREDTRPGKRLVHLHMGQYIAASSITHCFDGWSYFARAVDAELSGDPDAARHLGYYAELRA